MCVCVCVCVWPNPVAARSKAWVCGSLLACWECGFESRRGHGYVSVASATGKSLAQRSPTECGVSEYNLETSTVRWL